MVRHYLPAVHVVRRRLWRARTSHTGACCMLPVYDTLSPPVGRRLRLCRLSSTVKFDYTVVNLHGGGTIVEAQCRAVFRPQQPDKRSMQLTCNNGTGAWALDGTSAWNKYGVSNFPQPEFCVLCEEETYNEGVVSVLPATPASCKATRVEGNVVVCTAWLPPNPIATSGCMLGYHHGAGSVSRSCSSDDGSWTGSKTVGLQLVDRGACTGVQPVVPVSSRCAGLPPVRAAIIRGSSPDRSLAGV